MAGGRECAGGVCSDGLRRRAVQEAEDASLQVLHVDLVVSGSPHARDAGPRTGRRLDLTGNLRGVAATEFTPSYRRATLPQASLANLGFSLSVVAWVQGAGGWWLVGGMLLGAVVPFTLIVIMPVNKRLLDPTLDKRSAEAAQLLSRWGRLHAVRSIGSVLALLIFVSKRM